MATRSAREYNIPKKVSVFERKSAASKSIVNIFWWIKINYVICIVSICCEFFEISYNRINTDSDWIDALKMDEFIDEVLCRKINLGTCLKYLWKQSAFVYIINNYPENSWLDVDVILILPSWYRVTAGRWWIISIPRQRGMVSNRPIKTFFCKL